MRTNSSVLDWYTVLGWKVIGYGDVLRKEEEEGGYTLVPQKISVKSFQMYYIGTWQNIVNNGCRFS